MKTSKSRMGLSILTGAISFVGSANAIDLITNGSFELGTNAAGCASQVGYQKLVTSRRAW